MSKDQFGWDVHEDRGPAKERPARGRSAARDVAGLVIILALAGALIASQKGRIDANHALQAARREAGLAAEQTAVKSVSLLDRDGDGSEDPAVVSMARKDASAGLGIYRYEVIVDTNPDARPFIRSRRPTH